MVSNSNRRRTRPLWILTIHERLSMKIFKREVKNILEKEVEDICWVLKGNPKENVYKVTVETMENCETPDCKKILWVPEELAKATGEMFERFEKKDAELADISYTRRYEEEMQNEEAEVQEQVDKEYEEMRTAEIFDPYASDSGDNDDDTDEVVTDLNEENAETTI